MKKAIVIIAAIFAISTVVDAQKKYSSEEVQKTTENLNKNNHLYDSVKKAGQFKLSDTLVIKKAKAVEIDSVVISYDVLKEFAQQMKANKLPLYVSLDWVAVNYQFIKKATNPGLNDEQMDLLKQPLIPWIQYIQKLQEQQAQKQKQ